MSFVEHFGSLDTGRRLSSVTTGLVPVAHGLKRLETPLRARRDKPGGDEYLLSAPPNRTAVGQARDADVI
jgi:hypothetical protein